MSPKRQAETSHLFMLSLAVYLNSDIVLFGVGFHSEESMKCVTTSEGTETVNRLTLAKVFYNPCTLPDKERHKHTRGPVTPSVTGNPS